MKLHPTVTAAADAAYAFHAGHLGHDIESFKMAALLAIENHLTSSAPLTIEQVREQIAELRLSARRCR